MYVYDETNNCWISIRTTREYQAKKKLVRNAWIVIGSLMILMPPSAVLATALLTTFLSFTVLDESVYSFEMPCEQCKHPGR